MNTLKSLFTCFLMLAPLVACKTVNTVAPGESLANKRYIEDKRVITDPFLGSRAKILGVVETRTSNGFLRVQVEIENASTTTKHIEYLFEWFDNDGNLIPSVTRAYRVREILGRETIYLSAISPSEQAADFQLKLIRARR